MTGRSEGKDEVPATAVQSAERALQSLLEVEFMAVPLLRVEVAVYDEAMAAASKVPLPQPTTQPATQPTTAPVD